MLREQSSKYFAELISLSSIQEFWSSRQLNLIRLTSTTNVGKIEFSKVDMFVRFLMASIGFILRQTIPISSNCSQYRRMCSMILRQLFRSNWIKFIHLPKTPLTSTLSNFPLHSDTQNHYRQKYKTIS